MGKKAVTILPATKQMPDQTDHRSVQHPAHADPKHQFHGYRRTFPLLYVTGCVCAP